MKPDDWRCSLNRVDLQSHFVDAFLCESYRNMNVTPCQHNKALAGFHPPEQQPQTLPQGFTFMPSKAA
jgi:hypothetical protein